MMKAMFCAWLVVALLAWCGDSCAGAVVTNELTIIRGEHWWGGAAVFGTKMPFDVSSAVRIDLTVDNYSQQCDSLLISDQGRIAYSPKPAAIEVTNGTIRFVSGGEFEVRQEGSTLREAFLYASKTWFPPSGKTPAELFFTAPQYNTWVELNYQQNQESILKYARDFLAQGCPPGVIMIDDTWQGAYGVWDFDLRRFPDPKAMCDELHRMGFKVMLWICPWVGMDTPAYRRIALGHNPNDYRGYSTKGGFRMQKDRPELPAPNQWWNGCSALLDFTHPNARAWFTEQLDRLVKDYGIDGFKFDGGEFEHYTDDAISLGQGLSRAEEARAYALNALEYPYSEYRNGWHLGGQPIVQRLIDKLHTWEAVRQLIPDMMAAGLLGYQFVCPDMAGGGSWRAFLPGAKIDQDIFVRSVQVHALCGQMQFSASPWRLLDAEHQQAVREAVKLRQSFVPYILDLARTCAKSGEPMIRNLEYAYPRQGYAKVRDQFVLGEKLLVAPQVKSGKKTRIVLIPPGCWKGDDGTIVVGPCSIEVRTPLERIPHYVRCAGGERIEE